MTWKRCTAAEPTDRQKQVMEFILWHLLEKGFPPTNREIGKGVGLASTHTVHYHLEALERMGLITRGAIGQTRSIRLVTEYGPCPTCGHDPVSPVSRLHGAD